MRGQLASLCAPHPPAALEAFGTEEGGGWGLGPSLCVPAHARGHSLWLAARGGRRAWSGDRESKEGFSFLSVLVGLLLQVPGVSWRHFLTLRTGRKFPGEPPWELWTPALVCLSVSPKGARQTLTPQVMVLGGHALVKGAPAPSAEGIHGEQAPARLEGALART